MVSHNRGCLGEYDFDKIVLFARKRFVEGIDTVSLMKQAETEREREEIALVCLLSVDEQTVSDIQLSCRHDKTCNMANCRDLLRKKLNDELTK